jgi:glycosyltransferase involved in cell wall biosynthesis
MTVKIMKIAIVTPKSKTGERGGAENLYNGLVQALNNAGHTAVQVDVVVDESSFEGILEAYCNCYYMNLDEYDLVISTKSPTYMVRHRNHISYLLHTIRVFYDMFDKDHAPQDKNKQKQRKLIHLFDKYGLDPHRIKKHFTIGHTVSNRLKNVDHFWDDLNFEVIYPAPLINNFLDPKNGEFILLPGRLHRWKRIDLLIKAMQHVNGDKKLLLAGRGEDADYFKKLVKDLGLVERVEFLGEVTDQNLLELYSKAIVVPFIPVEEDFGYITIEAFKSKKPVITCLDSGEPANIVKDGISGFIVEPDPVKIAEKINYFIDNPDEATKMGENGYNSVQNITWEDVVLRLLKDIEIVPKENYSKISALITDMQPIDPAVGGGRLRLKGLYSNLGDNINSLYIGTYDWKGPKKREINISSSLKEVDIPLNEEHFKLNEYINKLLPDKTLIDSLFPLFAEASSDFITTVRQEAKKADVIIISHPWLYPSLKTEVNLRNKLLIYDSHNCEAILRQQILGTSPFANCIVNMVKFIEKELCEECDFILACSEIDKDKFEELYGVNPEKIEIFPNGVDANSIQPVDDTSRANYKTQLKLTQKTAIFIGSEYPPNVEAGNYIIDTLAVECPEVTFLIVGGVGNKLNAQERKNVKICGMVSDEDKKRLLLASDLAINPMMHGSGTNIKMFDFLAAGLPTISTPIGARGIENKGSFIVTDLSGFSYNIHEIFNDEELYRKLSTDGRNLVERCYDWNQISKKLGIFISANYKMNL